MIQPIMTPTAVIHRCAALPGLLLKTGEGAHAERLHAHTDHSIGFVRRGRTRVQTGADTSVLDPGQFIYIPPGTPHLCSPENPVLFAYTVLYFNSGLSGFPQAWDLCTRKKVCTGTIETIPGPSDIRTYGDMEALLDLCFRSTDWIGPAYSSILDIGVTNEIERFSTRFQAYRAYLERYGIGTHGCVQNERIERAKVLLDSGEPLADIALDCGFCDQSHFIRTFRLYTGMRPSDYRHTL